MPNVHAKVRAVGASGAITTIILAVIHLFQTGSVGVDTATLTAACLTVITFVAGFAKKA